MFFFSPFGRMEAGLSASLWALSVSRHVAVVPLVGGGAARASGGARARGGRRARRARRRGGLPALCSGASLLFWRRSTPLIDDEKDVGCGALGAVRAGSAAAGAATCDAARGWCGPSARASRAVSSTPLARKIVSIVKESSLSATRLEQEAELFVSPQSFEKTRLSPKGQESLSFTPSKTLDRARDT